MAGITVKQDLMNRQKEDFLMNDFTCVHSDKFEKGKKEKYCTKCINSFRVDKGTICVYGLDENW